MTWVVYVLLALNLALLTWNLQTRTVETTTSVLVVPPPGEANELPLLTELSADALRPRATTVAPVAHNRDSVGSNQTGSGEQTGPAVASVDVSSASEPNQNDNGGINRDPADPSLAVIATQDRTPSGSASGSPTAVAESGTSRQAPRACLTLGPLAADAPVGEISRWLEQAGASVDVRTDERREVALYWVFFPPRTSRELAVAEVGRLRDEGITDVIAVPKGDMANAISLGVFSRTDSRDRRVREMNQRGYQPSVAPRYRVKRASWVDVSTVSDTPTASAIQARWPDVEVSPKPCGTVAVAGEPVAAGEITAEADSKPAIAVGQGPSYNTSLTAPRRFFFSGSDATRTPQGSEASR